MTTLACVFVISGEDRALVDRAAARIEALEVFLAPTGLRGSALRRRAEGRHLVGRIGAPDWGEDPLAWGAPFGARGLDTPSLLRAGDHGLRTLTPGLGAGVAQDERAVRIVTAPSGPTALYSAQAPGIQVWSSHAVAAGWLARGRVELDPSVLPEYLAYDFVGGDRTFVAGVRSVAPAICVDLAAGRALERCYWPAAQRWSTVPEDLAHAHAEHALLQSIEARTHALAHVALGLTAGADSRVLALALDELGVPGSAFVWGEPEWPDVLGARRVAEALDVELEVTCEWQTDAETRRFIDADARWCDGVTSLAAAQRTWPGQAGAVVVGMAGEVGRAFYYQRVAAQPEPHGPRALTDVLAPESRLPHASTDAHATARAAVGRWMAAAGDSGHAGWRLLDVLYAEQRVARWGRSQVPALGQTYLTGFAPVEVMRGLASLPLADRASDGFHRRFVASRCPSLALPANSPSIRPPRWRRGASRMARRLRALRQHSVPNDPALIDLWSARPRTRDWVSEEVLGSALLAATMGDRWPAAVRAGFLRGETRATAQAMLACGPIALAQALGELR